jgi:predicted DNA-binding protein
MPTTHPRINITLDEKFAALLAQQAKQEHKSVAMLAKELILQALERREDMALSAIAKIRDSENSKKVSHQDVWK